MSLNHKEVRKSNALIEASYRLSVFEQRIILACLAQVKRGHKITNNELYKVSAIDIAEASGITPTTAYDHLKIAANRLFERRVTIHKTPEGDAPKKEVVTRWVQTCIYIEKQGHVEVRFGQDVIPYLTELSEQFTRYRYGHIAKMTSAHAIRLYEVLMQWNGVGKREVEIAWFREIMQLGDSYPSIKDFKKWVIEPAVKQINEHSQLQVSWEQRKTGRKVTHLTFRFSLKESLLKSDKAKPKEPPSKGYWYGISKEVLDRRANPGESYEDCALRLLEEAKKGK